MKNAWLNYILIRVGLFVGILVIMILLNFDKFFSALIAAALSLAISLIFFRKQRDRVSEAVYKRINRNDTQGSDDAESDLENAVLDAKKDPEDQ
jgi:ABC-type bacteriocin/lantibiotic exporter with double-glycine peptidase domain